MSKNTIGIGKLRNSLREYLRRVKDGETITITERGKEIAQIVPFKPPLGERMQSLIEAGIAEWNGQKHPPYQPKAVNYGPIPLSDLVIQDRR